MDKTGEPQRQPSDWSDELQGLSAQTMLVYADADSIPITHIAEFYASSAAACGMPDGTAPPARRRRSRSFPA